MSITTRERLAMSVQHDRERRMLRAVESIASSLSGIEHTLMLWYSKQYDDCDPFEQIGELAVKTPPDVEVREKGA